MVIVIVTMTVISVITVPLSGTEWPGCFSRCQFNVCVTEAHPAQTYQKEQEEEQAEASQKVSSCVFESIFKLFIAF